MSNLLLGGTQGPFPSGFAVETQSRVLILPGAWWVALSKTLALSGPWLPRLCREGESLHIPVQGRRESPYLLPSSFSLCTPLVQGQKRLTKKVEGSTQPRERVPVPLWRGTESPRQQVGSWTCRDSRAHQPVLLAKPLASITHTRMHRRVHTHTSINMCTQLKGYTTQQGTGCFWVV